MSCHKTVAQEFNRRRAQKIIDFRLKNNFTIEDLSKIYGISVEEIETIEANMYCPRLLFNKLHPFNYYFGELIKNMREERKLTKKDFAKAVKISVNTLRSYENHRRSPSINILFRISRYFNLGIDELFSLIKYDF